MLPEQLRTRGISYSLRDHALVFQAARTMADNYTRSTFAIGLGLRHPYRSGSGAGGTWRRGHSMHCAVRAVHKRVPRFLCRNSVLCSMRPATFVRRHRRSSSDAHGFAVREKGYVQEYSHCDRWFRTRGKRP